MTKQQKEIVKQLRSEGKGYGKISEIVKLSKSTISSYCKTLEKEASFCLTCSAKLKQTGGHRQKNIALIVVGQSIGNCINQKLSGIQIT